MYDHHFYCFAKIGYATQVVNDRKTRNIKWTFALGRRNKLENWMFLRY